jgi:hypothetical protein
LSEIKNDLKLTDSICPLLTIVGTGRDLSFLKFPNLLNNDKSRLVIIHDAALIDTNYRIINLDSQKVSDQNAFYAFIEDIKKTVSFFETAVVNHKSAGRILLKIKDLSAIPILR